MKRILYIPLITLMTLTNNIFAQDDTIKEISVSLNEYLLNVSKGNLGFIAEQFNVSIAEAGIKAARIFPDPEISVNYSNNQDQTLHMGQGIETGISYPVSLGNKRKANVAFARSQYELTGFVLEEFFCNLRADAALSYFATLRAQKAYQIQEDTYKQLQKQAQSDSMRLRVGEANEIDALQSALEAKAQLNNVFQSKAEMQNALAEFIRLQGKVLSDTLFKPSDDFPDAPRDFILSQLIDNAIQNKGEIKIALKNKEVSVRNLRLLKANRAFEFSLEAGYSYNSIVKNEIAPAPSFNSYNAGISIPLKFSNINRGDIHSVNLAIEQSEASCKDVELQITTEVTLAFNTYLSERKKIEHYNHGLIENAEKILKGRIYSYQCGESGLVDVINAQHTYNDLRNEYIETLYNYVSSLIELERAAGFWDLDN